MAQEEMTATETNDLARHEAVISAGLGVFFDVGCALAAIHSGRLYRLASPTWAGYCKARWGFSDRRADQLISAVEVVKGIKAERIRTTGSDSISVPSTERVAREVSFAPAADRSRVWDQAVREAAPGQPTTSQVRKIVAEAAWEASQPPAVDVQHLAAKALAGLPPAQQVEVLRAQKEQLRTETAHMERPGEDEARLKRVIKHLNKAANAAKRMPEEYETGRKLIAGALLEFDPAGATPGVS